MAELINLLAYLRNTGIFCGMVYLQEAHADDVWPLGYGTRSHANIEDRISTCKSFLDSYSDLKSMLNVVAVDSMNDNVTHGLGAWPERYFLSNLAGEIFWASDAGPIAEGAQGFSFYHIQSVLHDKFDV